MAECDDTPFTDMTDRELIIRLYAKLENLSEDVVEIKQFLRDRPCPSNLCKSHHDDIERLKYRNELIVRAFGAVATVLSIAIGAIALVVI